MTTQGRSEPEPLDLGQTLRWLRRCADLSQRELAARAGVPASTIARIESGAASDPRFRTVERLVSAAGAALAVTTEPQPLPTHPYEAVPDRRGRHFPAHLEARPVLTARDWWGAWWAHWYEIPRPRWPRPAPDHTFDLDRERRDQRRRRACGEQLLPELHLTRSSVGLPDNVRQYVAYDPSGGITGWLGGYLTTDPSSRQREFVLCAVEVAPAWRGVGLGRRLVGRLRDELRAGGDGVVIRVWLGLQAPFGFFRSCGFRLVNPQPAALTLAVAGSGERLGRGGEGGERLLDPPGAAVPGAHQVGDRAELGEGRAGGGGGAGDPVALHRLGGGPGVGFDEGGGTRGGAGDGGEGQDIADDRLG
ncbi:GNAT family N-acetyltransferase [Natronosporangium hydrolyticum]|uniref:GNAT family N-acetyltransferase n=1 Tax=Natronosporangium hydrolyticum TaxID=2811111 RepID=A0A895YGC4_9ACTN|nr:GNAT family N-acetyltransferase [Natronosporangium hydrolyticum]